MSGYQIDLDTIDLSNLNRQFLFRKPDISKPKALIAAATARHFNPSSGIHIHARHGNVKDGQNDLEWIKGFGLVMNALDNMGGVRRTILPITKKHADENRCEETCQQVVSSGRCAVGRIWNSWLPRPSHANITGQLKDSLFREL